MARRNQMRKWANNKSIVKGAEKIHDEKMQLNDAQSKAERQAKSMKLGERQTVKGSNVNGHPAIVHNADSGVHMYASSRNGERTVNYKIGNGTRSVEGSSEKTKGIHNVTAKTSSKKGSSGHSSG